VKLHPREEIVHQAEIDLLDVYIKIMRDDTGYRECISALARRLVLDELGPAELTILYKIDAWLERHPSLTPGEVASLLTSRIASGAKYLIRQERHGSVNKPGGLE